jgi:hypothetical protein
MNQHLVNHINVKLSSASNFVCKYMPVDINIDDAYEAMLACSNLCKPAMIEAFKEAVKYLAPQASFKRINCTMSDGRIASIQARLAPTDKWPVFLMPRDELTIDPESKFAALLATPIRVATEWESLTYIWEQLRIPAYGLEPYVLAYLMPWIRECLADFDVIMLPIEVPRYERKAIDKELSTVMNDWNVTMFPRMSKALSAVARSGKILLSQYRMLDAAYTHETLKQSPIFVDCTPSLVEPWLKEHLAEAMEEWQQDKAVRVQRQLDEVARRAAKRFDRLNPKG